MAVSRRSILATLSLSAIAAAKAASSASDLLGKPYQPAEPTKALGSQAQVGEKAVTEQMPAALGEQAEETVATRSSVDRIVANQSSHFAKEARAYAKYLKRQKLRYITPAEVIKPHAKTRREVRNSIPPRHMWRNIVATLKVADEIRHRLGVPMRKINSAYRSPAYNRTCPGAARRSTHTINRAIDVVFACSSYRVFRMAKQLRKEGMFKGGIGSYSSFTHIDTRGSNATW